MKLAASGRNGRLVAAVELRIGQLTTAAVAHRILMLAYYIIRDGTEYREAGGDYYDRRNPTKTAKRLARRP
jgi:hypothetical protein